MDFSVLTRDNVKLYAIKHYDNPYCSGFDEFEEDFKIPKYIKKLLNKYFSDGELKERLIINHLITFYNMFGQVAATRILFLRLDKEHYSALKTFLVFLKRCPKEIRNGSKVIFLDEIDMDTKVINILRKI